MVYTVGASTVASLLVGLLTAEYIYEHASTYPVLSYQPTVSVLETIGVIAGVFSLLVVARIEKRKFV